MFLKPQQQTTVTQNPMQISGCWISDRQAVNGLLNVDYSILINTRMRLITHLLVIPAPHAVTNM